MTVIIIIIFLKWKNHFLKIAEPFFPLSGVKKNSVFIISLYQRIQSWGGINLTHVAAFELHKTMIGSVWAAVA